MNGVRILVVDDQADMAGGMAMVLRELSSQIRVAHSGEQALELLREEPADLIFSDIRMPGIGGIELMERVQESWPRCRVILVTAHGTIDSAVEAMKLGALDYLTKPFERKELLRIAGRAVKDLESADEIARLRAELADKHNFQGIYSRDRRMLAIFDTLERVAPSDAAILVQGESGTGKELVAQALHALSPRHKGPFVAFNAAAVSENLAEAELFGAKRGAYTGASRDRDGLFVEANGGTVFIDEVGSMPMALQGKLLRALQEKEVLPVGASRPVKVDVRVVSSLNVDPMKLVREHRLRQDLFYRLSVVRIMLPALRDRVEDISLLCQVFLERHADKLGAPPKRLTARALRLLVSHDWPGNVRELQNVVERAALMCPTQEIGPGYIVFEDDDLEWQPGSEDALAYEEAKRRVLEQFQRRYVERLLEQTDGNVSAAARKAGITRAALHRILNRLDLNGRNAEPAGTAPN